MVFLKLNQSGFISNKLHIYIYISRQHFGSWYRGKLSILILFSRFRVSTVILLGVKTSENRPILKYIVFVFIRIGVLNYMWREVDVTSLYKCLATTVGNDENVGRIRLKSQWNSERTAAEWRKDRSVTTFLPFDGGFTSKNSCLVRHVRVLTGKRLYQKRVSPANRQARVRGNSISDGSRYGLEPRWPIAFRWSTGRHRDDRKF